MPAGTTFIRFTKIYYDFSLPSARIHCSPSEPDMGKRGKLTQSQPATRELAGHAYAGLWLPAGRRHQSSLSEGPTPTQYTWEEIAILQARALQLEIENQEKFSLVHDKASCGLEQFSKSISANNKQSIVPGGK